MRQRGRTAGPYSADRALNVNMITVRIIIVFRLPTLVAAAYRLSDEARELGAHARADTSTHYLGVLRCMQRHRSVTLHADPRAEQSEHHALSQCPGL